LTRRSTRRSSKFDGSCQRRETGLVGTVSTQAASAAKHAAASAVDILVERADGALTVQVRDDGVGGIMTLDSPAGAGTVLTVRLPVTAEDHLSERTLVHASARCEQAKDGVLAEGWRGWQRRLSVRWQWRRLRCP
jgi:hypothetical protein